MGIKWFGVKYFGGKTYLLDWIYSYFPDDFDCLVDVFGGGGWIMVNIKGIEEARGRKVKVKVFNDKDDLVVNFFMVLRDKKDELKKRLTYLPFSRSLREKYLKMFREGSVEDDIDKAVMWLYLLRTGFNGALEGGFGASALKNHALYFKNFVDIWIDKIADVFREVVIENLDFRDVIKKYDRPFTFFYLDPPYNDTYYRIKFTRDDLRDLINLVKGVKGKVMMSYWNDSEVLDAFKDWYIVKKEFSNRASGVKGGEKRTSRVEVLIMNYKKEESLQQAKQNSLFKGS